MPLNPAFLAFRSIHARRLHQREQFVDAVLRDLAHAIGVFHSGDVDAFYPRPDLVAKVGEKAQGIALLVGDARDQAGDQNLAGDHASVQFIHHRLRRLLVGRDMDDVRRADNRAADYLAAIWPGSPKLLMRSLMSRSVSRLVWIDSVATSCNTSSAIEARRLSRSSTSWRPAAVRNSLLARRSLGSCRRSRSPCSTRRSSSRTSEIGCNSSTSARSTCDSPSCCRNLNNTIHCARVVPRPLARCSI